jgi:imidazolonepropionase-like amidohydrolase
MKRYITICLITVSALAARAQDDIYPAGQASGSFFIIHGTIHVGNGQVIEDGTVQVENGKIVNVGTHINVPQDQSHVLDAKGSQVYPGLILPVTNLGLQEIANGVRGSNDFHELGDINPNIRSIVAYNTDSKIINTLRSNGIVLAGITPEGGIISGTSSVVQLDAWGWEDALYHADAGVHLNMPSFIPPPNRFAIFMGLVPPTPADPVRQALDKVEELKSFFRQAQAYLKEPAHLKNNIKFEAVRGLFEKKQKLFVHGDQVRQMLIAIDFAKEFGFDVVIVGGSESFQIASLLAQNHVPVILDQLHELPATQDDDVDQPFKTPAQLQRAGVLFALNDAHEETRYRNLMFNAGTAAAYGLSREEALQAITLNAAKILGIDSRTGSIEVGKDANLVVSKGDILDMRTSIITQVFIQGRSVSLQNKQTQLYDRYMHKYGLN